MDSFSRKFGGIDCLCAGSPDASHMVVMLHGYGANANDLFPLAAFLANGNPDIFWVFAEGPLVLFSGFMGVSRAWFPIDAEALATSRFKSDFASVDVMLQPGLLSAAMQLNSFLAALPIKPSKTIYGGFSQGSMLAMEIALNATEPPKGLLLFSSTVTMQPTWMGCRERMKGVPVFLSHGKSDDILPYLLAEKLHEKLLAEGLKVEFETFSGGHEIPVQVLILARDFLRRTLT